MLKPTLHYVGSEVTMKAVRDFILDKSVTENDIVLLNQKDFDSIVLEHRTTYNTSLVVPYYVCGVLVEEDNTKKVPVNRVGLAKNSNNVNISDESDDLTTHEGYYELIYRCGYCGDIVDSDGSRLSAETRLAKIATHNKYKNPFTSVTGKCCSQR